MVNNGELAQIVANLAESRSALVPVLEALGVASPHSGDLYKKAKAVGAPAEPKDRFKRDADALAVQFVPLAYKWARRYAGDKLRADDFIGEALIAIVKASRSFDPTRGVKFITYACRSLAIGLKALRESLQRHGFSHLGDSEQCHRVPYGQVFDGLLAQDGDQEAEVHAQIKSAVSEQGYAMLMARFHDGHSLRKIGETFGLSPMSVSRYIEESVQSIRERVGEHVM